MMNLRHIMNFTSYLLVGPYCFMFMNPQMVTLNAGGTFAAG
jgi:hypothetical protein